MVVADDLAGCQDVVRSLPEWFTPDVVDKIADEVAGGASAWVCDSQGGNGWVGPDRGIAGFVVLQQRFPRGAEITWAAVDRERQRGGLGRSLVWAALDAARTAGVSVVEVKTLDASADYEPYVATRAFWESLGFVQVDMKDPLPGWQAGNPSAIYVLPL